MGSRWVRFAFGAAASVFAASGCSSDDSDDGGGTQSGGGTGASGTGGSGGAAGSPTGGAGGTGGQAPMVDCAAVCNRVRTICEGQSTIDDTWVDVCTSACSARVELTPDVAVAQRDCVNAATNCTDAVLCVAA